MISNSENSQFLTTGFPILTMLSFFLDLPQEVFMFFAVFFFPVIVYPVEIAFKKRGPRITLEIGTHNPSYFGYQLRQDDGKETHKNIVCIDKLNKDQSKNCFYWFLIVVKSENGNI